MSSTSIDQLAAEIARAVQDYTEEVTVSIEQLLKTTTDEVLSEIKANAPNKTGKYVKGFKKKRIVEQGNVRWVIWNNNEYRLAHLLEFGHAMRRGGRVTAKPHIRPAYDRHASNLEDDIKRIIQNGGGP